MRLEAQNLNIIEEWNNAVNDEWIKDDNGSGYWVKDKLKSSNEVFSTSQLDAARFDWYNK